ncbi:hypothetical protein AC888_00650 [Bordetella pertussis]|nr:hypothetical protein AC888_00650 [Bordetella pertussis]
MRKWLGRFLAQGQAGLADASSRPTVSPRAIAPAKALAIVELRRKRLTQARIAQALGVSASTVSRVLARAVTRPYRPQTNGKAERFIQSALREWAYAHTYQNSQHRADAMKSWLHHYNWHRPHQGIGRAVPISRLNLDEYNLLTVHS